MIITVGQFTIGSRIAGKETGIPGMEGGEDISGYATGTTAFGIISQKNGRGGISPGIILPGNAKYETKNISIAVQYITH